MHEVGLVSAAIRQAVDAATAAGASRVERLTFTLRPAGHVSRESVRTLVDALARGTLVEGAALDFAELLDGPELSLLSIDVPEEAPPTPGRRDVGSTVERRA